MACSLKKYITVFFRRLNELNDLYNLSDNYQTFYRLAKGARYNFYYKSNIYLINFRQTYAAFGLFARTNTLSFM
jgi:hypothetical protein